MPADSASRPENCHHVGYNRHVVYLHKPQRSSHRMPGQDVSCGDTLCDDRHFARRHPNGSRVSDKQGSQPARGRHSRFSARTSRHCAMRTAACRQTVADCRIPSLRQSVTGAAKAGGGAIGQRRAQDSACNACRRDIDYD